MVGWLVGWGEGGVECLVFLLVERLCFVFFLRCFYMFKVVDGKRKRKSSWAGWKVKQERVDAKS